MIKYIKIVILSIILILSFYCSSCDKEVTVTYSSVFSNDITKIITKGDKAPFIKFDEVDNYDFMYYTYEDGNIFDFDKPVYNDIRLIAVYKECVTLTIVDLDDNTSTDVHLHKGDNILSSIKNNEKENYKFLGYSFDNSNNYITSLDTIEHNITIYAMYAKYFYTITYVFDDGSVVSDIVNNDSLPINKYNNLSKDGYTFIGWSEKKDQTLFDFNQKLTNDIMLYPVFEKNESIYSLTFSSLFYNNLPILEFDTETLYKIPELSLSSSDYTFLGWTTTNYDINDRDYLKTINIIDEIYVDGDIEIFAVWKKKYNDYSYLLDELIPSSIGQSIDLPTRYDNLNLIWLTSDQNVLTNRGVLLKPRHDTNVIIYLSVYDDGYITKYEKEVFVPKIEFKQLIDNRLTFGYYSSWNFFGYSTEIIESIDVINLCFAYVSPTFNISMTSLYHYMDQVLEAHSYGIRVVLSVQGYGSDGQNFSNAAKTEEGRKLLAKNMLDTCIKYNLDGIDIDWEYPGFNTGTPTSIDRPNYTLLMKEIYNTLKAYDSTLLFTAAIPGGPYTPSRFELNKVHNYLDYIHVMTYDLQAGGKSTHHTALYTSYGCASGCSVDDSVAYYKANGVPSSKIVIGLAFYGKYTVSNNLAATSSSYTAITYSEIVNRYGKYLKDSRYYFFDEVAKAPYLLIDGLFITYDNEVSIKAKCNYAKDNELAGIMIWELGEDVTNTLVKSVYDGMKK